MREKSSVPENSWLAITAGSDSVVRKTATAASVRKISSPEPTLRYEKTESPRRRPLEVMSPSLRPLGDGAGRGAVGVSVSGSAVLMGTFLRAGGVGAGNLVTAKPPSREGPAARRRAAWDQPTVMPSIAAWASVR